MPKYEYTLNDAGNRTKVEELNNRTVEWQYDELHRLVKEEIIDPVNGNQTVEYVYDQVGNRESRTVTTQQGVVETTYEYDENDRLKSVTEGSKVTNYTYDQNGNLRFADVQGSNEKVEYVWDLANRLIEVKKTDVNNDTTGASQLSR